jgi:hypothetical protein
MTIKEKIKRTIRRRKKKEMKGTQLHGITCTCITCITSNGRSGENENTVENVEGNRCLTYRNIEGWDPSVTISRALFPKNKLNFLQGSPSTLKYRYPRMYLPTEFVHSTHSYHNTFPLQDPLDILDIKGNSDINCHFRILDNASGQSSDKNIDPKDMDSRYKAKVMLLSSPPSETFLSMIWQYMFGCDKSAEKKYICKICKLSFPSADIYNCHLMKQKHAEMKNWMEKQNWMYNNIKGSSEKDEEVNDFVADRQYSEHNPTTTQPHRHILKTKVGSSTWPMKSSF